MDLIQRIETAVKEVGLDSSVMRDINSIVFGDHRPRLLCAYLFGNTSDNESSLFEAAGEMQSKSLASEFLVIEAFEANGFPGYENWSQKLERVVGRENIVPVHIEDPKGVNTYSESVELLNYTRGHEIEDIYVVGADFHQLRAMMTMASEVIERNSKLNLFSYPGTKLSLDEVALHSQGTLRDTRSNLVLSEIEKIRDYTNILPPSQILEYLQNRKIPVEK